MGIIRGIGPRCKRLVTGQTVPYPVGNEQEDDGHFEKGYARKYVALTTGGYSGTTNITVNSKIIAMENGCVIDQNTGLMWMKYTPDSDIGPGNNGLLYWIDTTNTNNEDIFTFCDAANTATLAGHSDWRVPNIFELSSLIVANAGIGAPYIDTTYFQCIDAVYWSSTTCPESTVSGLVARFERGYVDRATKTAGLYYVRLVRGG